MGQRIWNRNRKNSCKTESGIMATLTEEELEKMRTAHRKGFQAGSAGKQVNCPYQPDSSELISWDQGVIDGENFRLGLTTNG